MIVWSSKYSESFRMNHSRKPNSLGSKPRLIGFTGNAILVPYFVFATSHSYQSQTVYALRTEQTAIARVAVRRSRSNTSEIHPDDEAAMADAADAADAGKGRSVE
jgi:hypothetical protein